MKRAIILAAVAASWTLAGCQPEAETGNAARAESTSAESEVRAAQLRSLSEWQARNLDGVMAFYGPDAMVKFTTGGAMVGAAAIRAGIGPFLQDTNFQIQFAPDQVRVGASGDLASTRGSYTVRYTDPATRAPATETGTYVTVWQRQEDGSWRIVEDMTSGNPPPPRP